jgi:hypothetical protein
MTNPAGRITVYNRNHPGASREVDGPMYRAMEQALLSVVPHSPSGITLADLRGPVAERLPSELYPGGGKAGWWLKTVQLDLEARGKLRRTKDTPLRLYQADV